MANRPEQWKQSLWLTKTADTASWRLIPRVNLAYVVPTGAAYGSWAARRSCWQFNGFGNLFGIPAIA